MRLDVLPYTDAERRKLLDMSERLRRVQVPAVGAILVAALVCAPTLGLAPLLPLVVAALLFWTVQARLDRLRRPEVALELTWVAAQVLIAVSVVLAGEPGMLCVFAFPVALASVLFSRRTVSAGTLLSALLLVLTALVISADAVRESPPLLVYPLVVLVCTALGATAAREADVASRASAAVDELTGALNRAALEARVTELAHESAVTGEPVAVVLGDLDAFKAVNDEHGHPVGDAVLREVAERLSATLGAFESFYRLGGEEFVAVLAGIDGPAALRVAERGRAAVGGRPIAGLPVTISFGVAVSLRGGTFAYAEVFERADAALYAAKRAGRDRVELASGEGPAELVPRAPSPAVAVEAEADRESPARPRRGRDASGSRLLRDQVEREHMLDVIRRVDRIRHVGNAILLAGMVVAGPSVGWLPLLPVVLTSLVFLAIKSKGTRFRRPEYTLVAAWLVASAGYAGAFLLASEPPVAALPLLVLMNVGFSAAFPVRGVLLLGVVQAGLIVATAMLCLRPEVATDPASLAYTLALLVGVVLIGTVVGQSAVEHRDARVVDGLTGMLNRSALRARAAELSHQAGRGGRTVTVIVADIDSFKLVNDRHGHAVGDIVLREIGYRLRKRLRTFETAYRVGGEEFVVVLPDVAPAAASEIAERLRTQVCEAPIEGLSITMSFGVAATVADASFDFDELFARADEALYEAKRAGRDRVVLAGAVAVPQPVAA